VAVTDTSMKKLCQCPVLLYFGPTEKLINLQFRAMCLVVQLNGPNSDFQVH